MADLGDTVGLAVNVRNSAGTLTNATTAALTITLPDGTTSSPTVTNPPASTGVYTYDYTTTQAGRHTARWVFTTPNTAFTDTFDVRAAEPGYLLSLADAKAHLNMSSSVTTDDEELRTHLEAVTDYIEAKVGPVVRRTVTEVVDGTNATDTHITSRRQVLSVTSIVVLSDASTPVTLNNVNVEGAAGVLRLKDWTKFPAEPWTLTYVVGRTTVPASIILAAKMLLSYTWKSQRGPAAVSGTPLSNPVELLAYGHNVPPEALALLEPNVDLAGFA